MGKYYGFKNALTKTTGNIEWYPMLHHSCLGWNSGLILWFCLSQRHIST